VARSLVLLAALVGCAPVYAVKTNRTPSVWLHAVDMVAFSAGICVGLGARDGSLSSAGYSVAAAAWLPYWFVSTDRSVRR
jgi:hypothetical protein